MRDPGGYGKSRLFPAIGCRGLSGGIAEQSSEIGGIGKTGRGGYFLDILTGVLQKILRLGQAIAIDRVNQCVAGPFMKKGRQIIGRAFYPTPRACVRPIQDRPAAQPPVVDLRYL